ncbi:putative metal-binding membrane protein [Streptomyces glaucescens]
MWHFRTSGLLPGRSPAPTGAGGGLLPARELAVAWSLVVLIAVPAWVLTVGQARDMGVEPGTMGMALPLFLLLWVTMMAAMMLPSMAPVALTWVRGIGRRSSGWSRAGRTLEFVGGYLLVWTAFGMPAYAALAVTGNLVDDHPAAGRWIGSVALLLAGLYQLGPLKNVCLRHCRDPMGQLVRYTGFRQPARDLRVGLHHGGYCVGCCAGLMVVLVPLGVMNVAAMAGLAVVIFVEKLWSRGPLLAKVVGFVFLVLAVLAPFQDWLLPGLRESAPSMDGM